MYVSVHGRYIKQVDVHKTKKRDIQPQSIGGGKVEELLRVEGSSGPSDVTGDVSRNGGNRSLFAGARCSNRESTLRNGNPIESVFEMLVKTYEIFT